MKPSIKRAVTGAAALVLASGFALAYAGSASATTQAVGWEPDPNSQGSITLLDATGAPITSGLIADKPIAAYAVGSHAARAGDSKAQLIVATPQVGTNSQTWSSDILGAGPYNPAPAGTPAAVTASGLPFETGFATDLSLGDYIGEFPNSLATAGYQNLYQMRLETSGTSPADTTVFDTLNIQVDTTAGTWKVVYPSAAGSSYPDAADATTTTLTTNPTSPDATATNPIPLTLNASVATATAVPASYTGPIGTVSFFDGTTQVGTTQVVSGTGPYTASVSTTVANPASKTYTAKFAPYIGTGLTTSQATAPFVASVPAPGTTTAVSATPGAFAGDQNSYSATVTLTAGGTPACAGSVVFTDGGNTVGTAATPDSGSTNVYTVTNTFNSPGSHTISAAFSPTTPSQCAPSTGAAAPFTQAANPNGTCAGTGANCTDVQSIEATVPQGVLSITTPYSSTNPLNLGTMHLDSSGTLFTASATFGGSATDPTQDIYITDTRSGSLPWTAQAQSSDLIDGGANPGSTINSQNVGLTGLTVLPVTGNGFDTSAANLTLFNHAAASPATLPGNTGLAGLGNAPHDIAQAHAGLGSVGLFGTLTVNAPSSTEAGLFTGTVTFTLVGSLV